MQSVIVLGLLLLGFVSAKDNLSCGENAESSDCASLCRQTCQINSTTACAAVCIIGCVCKKGFVKKAVDGPCVPVAECGGVPQCGGNSELRLCGTACPATCQNPAPAVCSDVCVESCVCTPGYVLDKLGGKCVLRRRCVAAV